VWVTMKLAGGGHGLVHMGNVGWGISGQKALSRNPVPTLEIRRHES